jgi:hypothetical protein
VRLIQRKTSHGVTEILRAPRTVAGDACTGEACENILSDMTAIALETIMELPQRPAASALVIETRLWFRSMTLIAPLAGVVAAFARLMSQFGRDGPHRCAFPLFMTPNAALACVALRAFQTKAVDMFVVVERYNGPLFITACKDEPRRLRNNRMAASEVAFPVRLGRG